MTEVPEHLLRRSRERRAALGLGGEGGEGGGEAPASPKPAAAAETGSVEKAPAAAAPAAVEPAAPPPPPPPYVEAALRRKRIPYWAMAVFAFLPLWAIIYAGSLSPADTGGPTQLTLGGEIYAAQCAACHGGTGDGGVGRALSGGDVLLTFPNIEDQLEFVALGSAGIGPAGTPFGDPDREGGPHSVGSFNGNLMPAFGNSLTEEELLAVVRYEREVLSDEVLESDQFATDGTRNWSTGEPMLDPSTGILIAPDGQTLFDEEGRAILVAGTGGAANPGQLNPADE